jgi:hypothetical protein
MDHGACPTPELLEAFALGKAPSREFESIADHVQDCTACQAALQRFDGQADDLADRLRRLPDAGAADATLPLQLLQAACSAGSMLSAGRPSGISVDAGRRIAAALARGPFRLGKFELLEELGSGSFGTVFRARDTELDRTVAIKIQRAGALNHEADDDRFLREARSAAQLKHPHIVALYETGKTEEGICYLVSEYVEGRTLEQRLRERREDLRAAAVLAATLADALHYAHSKGVVHRDIKPANVMIDAAGQPHIMDFGLAKRDTGEVTVTQSGDLMGTPAYMSPEQACGQGHYVDARSDIFSLGVVLYELLTGERPFQGHRRMVLLQVLEEDPRMPRRLNDRIPRDLETICLKAMARAPARRYPTARDMADDLHRFLAGETIRARPVGVPERVWRWGRRNPVATSLALAVVLGLAAGLLHLSRLSGFLLRQTALDSASMHAEMLERMNALYSDAVATPMSAHGVQVTHDYQNRPGAIPLPATFTIDLGKAMHDSKYGMQVRLYSDFPFRTRKDGGAQDDFERQALQALRGDPTVPVHRFEVYDGRHVLRHATARLMQESCVGCHNTHPDSTKTDWKVGDVRGVLEIIHPLERDVARTRDGLRGTFVLMAVIGGAFLALAMFITVLSHVRRGRRYSSLGAAPARMGDLP